MTGVAHKKGEVIAIAGATGPSEWAPTHLVPRGGLDAWERPEAEAEPVAELGSGTGLQLIDTAGVWAHVRTDTGWMGWVDGRLIEIVGAAGEGNGDLRAWILLGIAAAVLVVLAVVGITGS